MVETGSLQFIWEDDAEHVLDADPDHPIVIYPERFHHVVITGAVQFRVEFYRVEGDRELPERQGDRPGAAFV